MNRTVRRISDDFKRKVVLEVLAGDLTKEAARRVYDIRGKSAVNDWIRRFSAEFSGLVNPEVSLPAMANEEVSITQLKSKIQELQKQLDESKHRSGLLETMIEIAEERFNIDIRKKSGAKRSIDTKRENPKPE
ncbi:MAG: transposase [Flavobacteriales bacterium]